MAHLIAMESSHHFNFLRAPLAVVVCFLAILSLDAIRGSKANSLHFTLLFFISFIALFPFVYLLLMVLLLLLYTFIK
jgi:hypothetical protein